VRSHGPGAAQLGRLLVAAIYLTGSVTHLLVATLQPRLYREFGEWAPITASFLRDFWTSTVVANATAFGLLVAAGELSIGILVLAGGRRTRLGLTGAIAFHLILAGYFGLWIYAVPAAIGLAVLMRYDFENAFARLPRPKPKAIETVDPDRQRRAA